MCMCTCACVCFWYVRMCVCLCVSMPLVFTLQGRTNLPPDKVPWSALRTLLSQCIYGGRIDNDFDQRLLNSFVNHLFTVKSFNPDFPLIADTEGDQRKSINIPEGIRSVIVLLNDIYVLYIWK